MTQVLYTGLYELNSTLYTIRVINTHKENIDYKVRLALSLEARSTLNSANAKILRMRLKHFFNYSTLAIWEN